ncbi:MAG: hypothetical protein HPY83_13385 [Anaerolineae bacterium]|nr:hypothetical protein [Anaerolineae bacterium]
MNSVERVRAALDFRQPDRVPWYFNSFWPQFEEAWRQRGGGAAGQDIEDYYEIDMGRVIPDETPFPSQRAVLADEGAYQIVRDGWGAIERRHKGDAWLSPPMTLEVALPDKSGADRLEFESPLLDSRFPSRAEVEALRQRKYVFVKVGGPYLRAGNFRGATQWLIDLVEDEAFARELSLRVSEHITAVGLQALRLYDLYDTAIWIYDDMGSNHGPMFSPRTFERVFLPCYSRMSAAFREAGVASVGLHCDGNVEAILDMLLDAGIDTLNPVEPKAGMDVVALRERYGDRLAFVGGLDNAHVLPRGDRNELERHFLHVLSAAREGGLVVGAHSVGPDISVETMDFLHRLVVDLGQYPLVCA